MFSRFGRMRRGSLTVALVAALVFTGVILAATISQGVQRKSIKLRTRTIWPQVRTTDRVMDRFADGYVLWDSNGVMRWFISPTNGSMIRGTFFVLKADGKVKDVTVSILSEQDIEKPIASTGVSCRAPLVNDASIIANVSETLGSVGIVPLKSPQSEDPAFFFNVYKKEPGLVEARKVPFSIKCRIERGKKYWLLLERKDEKPKAWSESDYMSDYVFVLGVTVGSSHALTTRWRRWTELNSKHGSVQRLEPLLSVGPELLAELEILADR